MRINGKWKLCEDGIIRPVISGELLSGAGFWETVADRTVLSAATLAKLGLSLLEPEEDISGLGGVTGSVMIETKLNLPRDDGKPVIFTSRFTAVTEPGALDLCVLDATFWSCWKLRFDSRTDQANQSMRSFTPRDTASPFRF